MLSGTRLEGFKTFRMRGVSRLKGDIESALNVVYSSAREQATETPNNKWPAQAMATAFGKILNEKGYTIQIYGTPDGGAQVRISSAEDPRDAYVSFGTGGTTQVVYKPQDSNTELGLLRTDYEWRWDRGQRSLKYGQLFWRQTDLKWLPLDIQNPWVESH